MSIDTDAIYGRNRIVTWWGFITPPGGSTVRFEASDLKQGGQNVITRQCCEQNKWEFGTVYATELKIELLKSFDRYSLPGGKIELYAKIEGTSGGGSTAVQRPMGVFYVYSSMQKQSTVQITAYDKMLAFEEPFTLSSIAGTAKPYNWIAILCQSVGVTLATQASELSSCPNMDRQLGWANVSDKKQTYRDLLRDICSAIGCNAFIDAYDRLVVVPCYNASVKLQIAQGMRYSSSVSDYRTYISRLYLDFKAQGIKEKYALVADNGTAYDLGANGFLQITDSTNRSTVLNNLLNYISNMVITPFDITMPLDHTLDLMDVIQITGGQAGVNDTAPITYISRPLYGKMRIKCGGENPAVSSVINTETSIASADSLQPTIGTNMVSSMPSILIDTSPKSEETVAVGVRYKINEIEIQSGLDTTRVMLGWTACYTLSEAATVTVEVIVDGSDMAYIVSDVETAGIHTLSVNCGFDIEGEGQHIVSVYLTETI